MTKTEFSNFKLKRRNRSLCSGQIYTKYVFWVIQYAKEVVLRVLKINLFCGQDHQDQVILFTKNKITQTNFIMFL